jgi:hypothetical protein
MTLRRSKSPMVSGLTVGMHLHPERGVDALLEPRIRGLTYVRVAFPDAAQQAYFAKSVLPLVHHV